MTTGTASKRAPVWLAMVAASVPILAWTVHLVSTAALVEESCDHSGVRWVMHGLTAALALVCVACGLFGYVEWKRTPASAGEATGDGNGEGTAAYRFLAILIVAIAITNLVLIVWEGSYTEFLSSCH